MSSVFQDLLSIGIILLIALWLYMRNTGKTTKEVFETLKNAIGGLKR